MIKKFDKSAADSTFARKFRENYEAGDYEGAIDMLMKYSEVTDNPDFHLDMGILYLMLCEDSYDKELFTLAFREFMLHLRTDPTCEAAYRGLIATALIRHSTLSLAAVTQLARHNGKHVNDMLDRLSEYGIDMDVDDNVDYVEFEELFDECEFGKIMSGLCPLDSEEQQTEQDESEAEPKKKVISFRRPTKTESAPEREKKAEITRMRSDELTPESLYDLIMSMEEDDDGVVDDLSSIDFNIALRDAQDLFSDRRYDEALKKLDGIRNDGTRRYYYVECLRANIKIEQKRFDEAQRALDSAFAINPSGALAGTEQCLLYDILGKRNLIPAALKRIDVTDFYDSEHAYRAMMYAVDYCNPEDTLMLAEQYIEEFNIYDIRKIRAQILYNMGRKKEAVQEFYILSRVMYDDFCMYFNYLMSKSDVDELSVQDDTPQPILGAVVETFMAWVLQEEEPLTDGMIRSEAFQRGLEVFVTLEFRNRRKITKQMFDVLRVLANDPRLTERMECALVSPYVEPLVKSILLGELLYIDPARNFLCEVDYCPIWRQNLPALGTHKYNKGFYTAYALGALTGKNIKATVALCKKLRVKLADEDDKDVAYFVWKKTKDNTELADYADERIEYALGYESKARAVSAYKALSNKYQDIQ